MEQSRGGFTLIELSIVLVLIGLIVGGILVGQSLMSAATIRAQITQIEKFNQAANTFRDKYSYLPGDISSAAVTQFNFTASPTRMGTPGAGDGNGELDGNTTNPTYGIAFAESGENLFFWEDLSTNSHLIEGSFKSASGAYGLNPSCNSNVACSIYFPSAKVGNGASVYVYSGYAAECCSQNIGFGPNFFGLSIINSVAEYGNVGTAPIPPAPALTVAQAYAIDTKVDDGRPTTGNVLAQYLTAAASGGPGWSGNGATSSASTCYDTSSGTAAYSIEYQNGSMVTCGISFKMQARD